MAEPVSLTTGLTFVYRAVLVLTFAIVLLEYSRRREPRLRDSLLMLGSLAVTAPVGWARDLGILDDGTMAESYVGLLSTIAIIAHPYLMIRLVKQFRAVPAWVEIPSLAGLVGSWGLWLYGFARGYDPTPSWITLIVIAYFTYAELYAAGALVRGALRSAGVSRNRMLFAAAGTGILGFVILLAGLVVVIEALRPVTAIATNPLALASFLAYYLGFAPPKWLRRSWQLGELERFVSQSGGRLPADRAEAAMQQLHGAAVRLTGAGHSALVTPLQGSYHALVRSADGSAEEAIMLERAPDNPGEDIMRTRGAALVDVARATPAARTIAERLGGRTILVVPVADGHTVHRLLAVPLREVPMFVDETIQTLTVLAEQTAIALSVQKHVEEQEALRLREARIASEELRRQNLAMQEASRLKSEFLANMSHELRTPLNGIIGFADLMASGKVGTVNPQHAEFLGDILTSARHLLQLINDVLDLAKVEAGRMEFRPERLDPYQVLDEALVVVRPLAQTKSIELVLERGGVPELVVDPVRFKQLAYNYVSNAIKFTPEGGRVTVRVQPEGEDRARFEVQDTGVGIGPQDIPKLFHEFQQLDAGTAKHHQGTGLGLALVRRLVEAQGGSVGVQSAPGKGSTFHAILPRVHSGQHTMPVTAEEPLEVGPRVLVVDDEEHDREAIAAALRTQGYLVDAAATGREALELIAKRAYDAATIDLILPDLHGYDIIKALRETSVGGRVAVLIVTKLARGKVHATYPVDGVFQKPVDPAALADALEKAGIRASSARPVLVVDDDASVRRLVEVHLRALGYRAVLAADGNEAIEAVAREEPALIVLDLVMPGKDGFAFLDEYRARGGIAPVIVWTSKDLTADEAARLRGQVQIIAYKADGGSFALANRLEEALKRR